MLFGKVSAKEYNKLKSIKLNLEVELEDKTKLLRMYRNENNKLRNDLELSEFRYQDVENSYATLKSVVIKQMEEINRLNAKIAELTKPVKKGRKPKVEIK